MRRRHSLAGSSSACAAPAALVAFGAAAPAPGQGRMDSSTPLLRTYLTSLATPLPAELKPGTKLLLERAPERAFDRRSIAAHTVTGLRVGYLPGQPLQGLAAVMDHGLALEASVVDCRCGQRPAVTLDLWLAEHPEDEQRI